MSGLVLLVAGIFLDFGAALILIVPLVKFQPITQYIVNLQERLIEFGLIIGKDMNEEMIRARDDILYSWREDVEGAKKMSAKAEKYDKEFFPYGLVMLSMGFVMIVLGTLFI